MRKVRNACLGLVAVSIATAASSFPAVAQQTQRPNILVIFGDDIGQSDVSAYTFGLMGYPTPNIDRIAKEGTMFTDYYAEQSCTAGRSSFITGQSGPADQSPRWEFPPLLLACNRRTSRSPRH